MTIGDNSISAKALADLTKRIENMNEEIKSLQLDRKAIFDEAKRQGFDTKVMKRVIRERQIDKEELDEFNMLTEVYWGAMS